MRWIPAVFVLACAGKSDQPAAQESSDTPSSPPLSSDTAQSVDSEEDTAESDTNAPGDSGEVSEDTGAAPPPVGWRSALFPDDWVPGFGVATGEHFAQLQDFSYAGYRAGEEALPVLASTVQCRSLTTGPMRRVDRTALPRFSRPSMRWQWLVEVWSTCQREPIGWMDC